MARVTVEDCLERVSNRFALTVLASRRARALCDGRGTPMVECVNKQAVSAIREIASDRVRYVEDVAEVMKTYIDEQIAQLRTGTTDNAFLEAASFGPLESDSDDGEADLGVAELTSDLTSLSPTGENGDNNNANDDSGDDTEEETTEAGPEAETTSDSLTTDSNSSDDNLGFDGSEATPEIEIDDDDADDDDDDAPADAPAT